MKISFAVGACLALALPLFAQSNLIQNGSFEANGGANSNVLPGWSIVDEAGGSGTWVAQTGATGPVSSTCGPDDVEVPPDGSFAAMTTQAAAGSHVLYQDVTIPAGQSAVLSFQYFIHSAGSLSAPDSLSYATQHNQQFRVDIIDPASNPFTLDVLQSILLIGDGNPRTSGYQTQSAVLAGLGGRTVRLRFVEVDNDACFYAGVDDVRLETSSELPTSIARFTSTPSTIPFAGATTFSWVSENATSVSIDNGIGAVPSSGSRSVSLQTDTTFTLTAIGPSGTVQRTVSVSVSAPGPSINFSADPSFIEPGQLATLSWSTDGATDVSIDNGIGAVSTSGSLSVTPSKTTEYTLTATGSNVTTTSRATVFVDPGDVPIVSVTSYPSGVVQLAGSPVASVEYALTNLGHVGTNVQLAQSRDFFTQSPTSFALAAGATQIVTITMTTQAAGNYQGASLPSGNGIAEGLTIPVRMFLSTPPNGTVAPTFAVARTEVAAPADENPSGSVSYTNSGSGTLQGIVTSDVPWLIPQSDPVIIGPGETKQVTFTTNRALRPDAASPAGAATGTLTLTYLDFAGASAASMIIDEESGRDVHVSTDHASSSGGSQSTISVTVVDVVKPRVSQSTPQPLGPGEIALFVPGLARVPTSSGDLIVSIVGNSISDLKLYLGTPDASPVLGSLDQIAPNAGVAIPSILQSVFASAAPIGTVQARSASLARVSLAGVQTSGSSFLTALPTFRSDLSAGAGQRIHLPGVEKSAGRSTNLIVQEVTGYPATAKIEFLAVSGNVMGSRDESVGAFALLPLPDVVPAGAAAVRVTNTSANAARIVAYATVIDDTTSDGWTIVDSQTIPSNEQIVAVIAPPAKAWNATNEMFVLNPNSSAVEVTFENRINTRKRLVGSRSAASTTTTLTIAPRQTVAVPIAFAGGFIRVTAPQPFVLSARTEAATFGSALPATSAAAALAAGESRRFGGVDDSSRATAALATPLTYRSNLDLIETAGQPAVVRLTLRYSFSAGNLVTAQAISSTNVDVPANGYVAINGLARRIIGTSRDVLGDLHNMQLDVEVVSGRVLPFLQVINNGSGDEAIREH